MKFMAAVPMSVLPGFVQAAENGMQPLDLTGHRVGLFPDKLNDRDRQEVPGCVATGRYFNTWLAGRLRQPAEQRLL